MDVIYLIGYMGSGKTTLGEAVARRTGWPFVDLDRYIERWQGCSISDIFATRGEGAFRALEREALTRVASGRPAGGTAPLLVACGGGTPCQPGNMDIMNCSGLTVWLDAPHDALLRRLKAGRAQRPLIARLDDTQLGGFIAAQMALRAPHYSRAALRLDSSRLESESQIEDTVDTFTTLISHAQRP